MSYPPAQTGMAAGVTPIAASPVEVQLVKTTILDARTA